MDWTAQFDAYCERTDLTLWSEPVNAVTNAAFLIAAVIMWRRTPGITGARILCGILFVIGIGSLLFHTFATGWAAMMDNLPILSYILTFLYLTHRHSLDLSRVLAALSVVLFIPYAAAVIFLLGEVPFFGISAFYWTVPILLVIYAVFLRQSQPALARGYLIGATILSASITVRSIDEMLCHFWPIGTHFGWHILNAVMLAYMIRVYATHGLGKRGAGR